MKNYFSVLVIILISLTQVAAANQCSVQVGDNVVMQDIKTLFKNSASTPKHGMDYLTSGLMFLMPGKVNLLILQYSIMQSLFHIMRRPLVSIMQLMLLVLNLRLLRQSKLYMAYLIKKDQAIRVYLNGKAIRK